MTENRKRRLRSLDKRFFINLRKEAKMRNRRSYVGKDGEVVKIKKGGEKNEAG